MPVNKSNKGHLDDVIQLFNQWVERDKLLSPEEIDSQQEFMDSFLNKSNKDITLSMFLKLLEQDLNENTITLDTNLMDYIQILVQRV